MALSIDQTRLRSISCDSSIHIISSSHHRLEKEVIMTRVLWPQERQVRRNYDRSDDTYNKQNIRFTRVCAQTIGCICDSIAVRCTLVKSLVRTSFCYSIHKNDECHKLISAKMEMAKRQEMTTTTGLIRLARVRTRFESMTAACDWFLSKKKWIFIGFLCCFCCFFALCDF